MKKLVLGLVLVSLVFTAAPLLVNAQNINPIEGCVLERSVTYGEIDYPEGSEIGPEYQTDPPEYWAILCVINVVNRAAQVTFFIMMGLVVILVIIGGFFILTAGANEENVDKGKKYITYAIIGVAISVFAYAVPDILTYILGA